MIIFNRHIAADQYVYDNSIFVVSYITIKHLTYIQKFFFLFWEYQRQICFQNTIVDIETLKFLSFFRGSDVFLIQQLS